ncbi:MAG: preprotein translocase subunit SecG [Rhodopirellula sp.]|nr:preprotein translocase subunit SecG [Rhodopirellula sp.]
MTYLLLFLLLLLAFFLIVLVLIQRGKGGGLAGAFGGMGGQSAFGTKAGDLFTRITIGVATVWILVCIISVKYIGATGNRMNLNVTPPPATGADENPAGAVQPNSEAVPDSPPSPPPTDGSTAAETSKPAGDNAAEK